MPSHNGHTDDPSTGSHARPSRVAVRASTPFVTRTDTTDQYRVIVVGNTPIAQQLRGDDDIDLIRARSLLVALGELAHPAPGTTQTAVLLSAGHDASDLEDAAHAIRTVDAHTRVLAVGSPTHNTSAVDGCIAPDALAQTIKDTISLPSTVDTRPPSPPSPPSPPIDPSARPTPPASSPTHAQIAPTRPPAQTSAPAASDIDDAVTTALLGDHDIVPILESHLAHHLGDPQLRIADADSEPDHAVPLEHDGTRLGWIITTAPDEAVRQHTTRCARWLALANHQRQLQNTSLTDELTGAWNRRYFNRFIASALSEARNKRLPVTLLYFDIDDFKRYNDAHGHDAGDEILIEVVALLNSVIRPSDRVCRIGGDEFVVVFYEPDGPRSPTSTPPQSIWSIAKRFQEQICSKRFPKLSSDAPGTLGISGGLATYPWDGRTAQELINVADQLALQSKRQGKNVITLGPGAKRVCGLPPQ